ncbi:endonuclease LCL3 [Pestalotiopsis fici W106-1]|uniref:Probable endonuclease LCL3 n=1 Tax=Pestalotiopsis fici (strain W106-1 / CGMCC3.15140) TaxID=1229662 RepID=W3XQ92_PESFW|nr:endonuclease LCL3 [Pestalotiopsis fici W106-1]ETS88135.1 endonuclease LCL3 [Pestalotiopsis fici W106-1]
MPWPFGTGNRKDDDEKSGHSTIPWTESLNNTDWQHFKDPRNWVPTVLVTTTILVSLQFYRSYLRRFPGAAHVQPSFFRKRSLFGKVTSVGDGDNFHLFHTPGGRLAGWGWLRRIPEKRPELKGKTIPVRLAGIDAPEGAHFGKPAQPFATDALAWLSDYVLGRRVRAKIYKRDQYDRVVATVFVRRFFLRKDVGLEMLKRGLATTYEAKSGAEFGGLEEKYRAAEAKAKAKKLGIWGGKPEHFESPRDFKTRMNQADA